jgi:hypothetical protein
MPTASPERTWRCPPAGTAGGHRLPVSYLYTGWFVVPGAQHGVTGRYRLVEDGQIVVPAGTGSFFERNPRTIASA